MKYLYYLLNAFDPNLFREIVYGSNNEYTIMNEFSMVDLGIKIEVGLIIGDYYNLDNDVYIFTFYNQKESMK